VPSSNSLGHFSSPSSLRYFSSSQYKYVKFEITAEDIEGSEPRLDPKEARKTLRLFLSNEMERVEDVQELEEKCQEYVKERNMSVSVTDNLVVLRKRLSLRRALTVTFDNTIDVIEDDTGEEEESKNDSAVGEGSEEENSERLFKVVEQGEGGKPDARVPGEEGHPSSVDYLMRQAIFETHPLVFRVSELSDKGEEVRAMVGKCFVDGTFGQIVVEKVRTHKAAGYNPRRKEGRGIAAPSRVGEKQEEDTVEIDMNPHTMSAELRSAIYDYLSASCDIDDELGDYIRSYLILTTHHKKMAALQSLREFVAVD
tara:strand:- start:989 stop:1924 length:936 start_codon:yes stop_codon:yes gene_type:complete